MSYSIAAWGLSFDCLAFVSLPDKRTAALGALRRPAHGEERCTQVTSSEHPNSKVSFSVQRLDL